MKKNGNVNFTTTFNVSNSSTISLEKCLTGVGKETHKIVQNDKTLFTICFFFPVWTSQYSWLMMDIFIKIKPSPGYSQCPIVSGNFLFL